MKNTLSHQFESCAETCVDIHASRAEVGGLSSQGMVDKVISGDELVLDDGRVIRLAGIKTFAPDATKYLETNATGFAVTLQNAAPDRYGRVSATVTIAGENRSLETMLLDQGLAFVYPASSGDDALLAAESAARAAHKGWWATHSDTKAEDAEKLCGSYGFVIGTITKAQRIKNKVYLNFGSDEHTVFAVEIAAHDLRAFKKQDIDPLTLQGKTARVRGWIKRDSFPMTIITDPHQLELTN